MPAAASALPTPLSVFGTPGTGAGQLDAPAAVAIDGSGNIYVGEQTNHRISVFTPGGTFVRAFGRGVLTGGTTAEVCTATTTCQIGSAGTGAGELDQAGRGMTVDAAGQLYVPEANNQRISVFNSDGTFARAFGWGVNTGASQFEVCTTASACQAGLAGDGNGQLNFPTDADVDTAGNLYVADSFNNRISVFATAAPSFLRAFGLGVDTAASTFQVCTVSCEVGDSGNAAGSLSSVGKLTLGPGGLLHANPTGNRINVFDVSVPTAPSFARAVGIGVDTGGPTVEFCDTTSSCQQGANGFGAGQLGLSLGLGVDSAGLVSVVETQANRISVFDPAAPAFVHAFGRGVDTGMAVFEVCTTTSTCQFSPGGEFDAPTGLAVDCRDALWVPNFLADNVRRVGEPGTALPPCVSTPPAGNPPATPAKKKCKKGQKLRKGKCVKKRKKKKK
jgi:hypothetical protein